MDKKAKNVAILEIANEMCRVLDKSKYGGSLEITGSALLSVLSYTVASLIHTVPSEMRAEMRKELSDEMLKGWNVNVDKYLKEFDTQ